MLLDYVQKNSRENQRGWMRMGGVGEKTGKGCDPRLQAQRHGLGWRGRKNPGGVSTSGPAPS